jgi:hypothetical protein
MSGHSKLVVGGLYKIGVSFLGGGGRKEGKLSAQSMWKLGVYKLQICFHRRGGDGSGSPTY